MAAPYQRERVLLPDDFPDDFSRFKHPKALHHFLTAM